MSWIRGRLTYANVISTLCLFLLLGGGAAFAAVHLPRNSVGQRQLKRHSVGPAQMKRNAVNGSKIRDGAITSSKLSASTISALKTPPSPLDTIRVEGAPLLLVPGEFAGAPDAQCPSGYVVVGTGFYGGVAEPGFVLSFGTFVGGFFANESLIVTESNVQAICAKQREGGATASSNTARHPARERFKRMVAQAEKELRGS